MPISGAKELSYILSATQNSSFLPVEIRTKQLLIKNVI